MLAPARTAAQPSSGDHGDRDLAARAGRGDEQAFAELYDRHAAGLLAFASQYVGDRAAAEDVVQQTFLAAYRVLSAGTEIEHPRAWLYHVARNNSLTTIRDRGPAGVDAVLAAELHDRAAAVPVQVERREALQEVVRDIVALPAEQRAALALYELGDLSQAEIADTLGCKPARVKALVFQARASLVTQREARDASCETVREKLATFHGGALNQRLIRHHLRGCEPCTAYRDELRDQRRRVALLLPLLPLPGLREAVLGVFGGGAAATATAPPPAPAPAPRVLSSVRVAHAGWRPARRRRSPSPVSRWRPGRAARRRASCRHARPRQRRPRACRRSRRRPRHKHTLRLPPGASPRRLAGGQPAATRR